MTVVTIIAAGDVRRVFSGCSDAVMTGTAGPGYLCMVDRIGRRPHIAVVAVLADIRGLYVCQILASGFDAVMAAEAVARDIHVIECRGSPGNRRVTIVAGIVAGDVRRVFADCDDAVMTGAADADDMRVVDGKCGHEHIGVVAVFADVTGLNMCLILAACIHAVMAVNTVARNVEVVKIRWQPGNARVAVVAGIAARDVCRILASCGDAVVTGTASADDLRMVDRDHGRKHIRAVAILADVAGLNVRQVLARGVRTVVATKTIIDNVYVVEDRW